MSLSLDDKLSRLIHEIKEIRKEMMLKEPIRPRASKQKITRWKSLGQRVSEKWNGMSAVQEISFQREKTW